MTSYIRNLFGGPNQTSKSHGESRSRSRPAPAVAYTYKPAKSGTSEPTPSRPRRSRSTTRSHAPSPLRDVSNEPSQRPALQRSSSSRSYSKSTSTSSSSHSQYSGPGTGECYLSPRSGPVLRLVLGPHYQIRSPDTPYLHTPTSSRTGSSASLHPGTPSVAFLQPLSRSTSHTQTSNKMPSRPALKSANTWASTGTTSSIGSTCISYLLPSRKPDLLVSQIPHPTHDPTLRSTNHPASTCIPFSPIHVFITRPSSTMWVGLRQLGQYWTAPHIPQFRPTPLPSLLAIPLLQLPISWFSGHTNSHGRSS